MADDELSTANQESFCTAVALINDQRAAIIASAAEEVLEHFDSPFDIIMGRCIEFRKEYKEPPGKGHIDDIFADILENPDHKLKSSVYRYLETAYRQADQLNLDYLVAEVDDFVILRKLRAAIGGSANRYQQGGKPRRTIDDVEQIWRETLQMRSRRSRKTYGFTLADADALSFLDRDTVDYCKLGIKEFDDNGVYPGKRELFLFLAARNRGKCLEENTLILVPNGSRIPIKEVVVDKYKEVMSFDVTKGCFVPAAITGYWDNGIKDCVAVTTVSGYSITATKNHPFLTPSGWVIAEDLKPDSYVAVSRQLPDLGGKSEKPELLRLLGYLISDAQLAKTHIGYTKYDQLTMTDLKLCVKELGDDITNANHEGNHVYVVGGKTLQLLREHGLSNKKSRDKFVPKFIFNLNDTSIIEFLSGLFSGDSSLYIGKSPVFEYCSASSKLVEDVKHLLIRLGISSKIKYFSAKNKGELIPGYAKITIKRKADIAQLLDLITFRTAGEEKRKEIYNLCQTGNNKAQYKTKELSKYANYEKIKEIVPVGEKHTYDITVDPTHCFIANDLIVHNSMFLHHCGKQALMKGWQVAHYTLENSGEMSARRYYQTLFNGVLHEGNYHYTELDENGDSHHETLTPDFIVDKSEETRKFLVRKQTGDNRFMKLGNIRIREFPTGQLSYTMLERDLDELALVHNFKPDMILLDYPQIMKLPRRAGQQDYSALTELTVNLRGLAVERDIALVCPQQGNRSSERAGNVRGDQGGGSIEMLSIADNALTYSQTSAEEEHGFARLYAQKVRNDKARFTVMITQHYGSAQFCMSSHYMSKALAAKVKAYTGTNDEEDEEYEIDDRVKK